MDLISLMAGERYEYTMPQVTKAAAELGLTFGSEDGQFVFRTPDGKLMDSKMSAKLYETLGRIKAEDTAALLAAERERNRQHAIEAAAKAEAAKKAYEAGAVPYREQRRLRNEAKLRSGAWR